MGLPFTDTATALGGLDSSWAARALPIGIARWAVEEILNAADRSR